MEEEEESWFENDEEEEQNGQDDLSPEKSINDGEFKSLNDFGNKNEIKLQNNVFQSSTQNKVGKKLLNMTANADKT